MSEQQNSEEVQVLEPGEEEDLSATQTDASDDDVDCRIQFTVLPTEVSMFYTVSPKNEGAHISTLSASLVSMRDGVLEHSYLGSSQAALVATAAGQGYTGDVGCDMDVFAHAPKKSLFGLVAGVVKDADGNVHNYFFTKQFYID